MSDQPEVPLEAMPLADLIDLAFKLGHPSVKFKQTDKCVVLTAPPCYHVEAADPTKAMVKMLKRTIKHGGQSDESKS